MFRKRKEFNLNITAGTVDMASNQKSKVLVNQRGLPDILHEIRQFVANLIHKKAPW